MPYLGHQPQYGGPAGAFMGLPGALAVHPGYFAPQQRQPVSTPLQQQQPVSTPLQQQQPVLAPLQQQQYAPPPQQQQQYAPPPPPQQQYTLSGGGWPWAQPAPADVGRRSLEAALYPGLTPSLASSLLEAAGLHDGWQDMPIEQILTRMLPGLQQHPPPAWQVSAAAMALCDSALPWPQPPPRI
jgi:hypothetical protein